MKTWGLLVSVIALLVFGIVLGQGYQKQAPGTNYVPPGPWKLYTRTLTGIPDGYPAAQGRLFGQWGNWGWNFGTQAECESWIETHNGKRLVFYDGTGALREVQEQMCAENDPRPAAEWMMWVSVGDHLPRRYGEGPATTWKVCSERAYALAQYADALRPSPRGPLDAVSPFYSCWPQDVDPRQLNPVLTKEEHRRLRSGGRQ